MSDVDQNVWALLDEETALKNEIANDFKEYDYIFILKKYLSHIKYALNELNSVDKKISDGSVGNYNEISRLYAQIEYHYYSVYSIALSAENYLYSGLKQQLDEANLTAFHGNVLDVWKRSNETRLFKEIRNRTQHGNLFEANFKYFHDLFANDESKKTAWSFDPDDHFWQSIYGNLPSETKKYYDSSVKEQQHKLLFIVEEYSRVFGNLIDDITSRYSTMFPDVTQRRNEKEKRLHEVKSELLQKGIYDPF